MRLSHQLRDVQADPHTRKGRGFADPARERTPQAVEVRRGDTDPPVAARDLGDAVLLREPHRDLAAAGRVLHRVPNKVHEQLIDARLVAVVGKGLR